MLNFLSPIGFQFSIAEAEKVSFNIQGLTLPGVSLGSALRPTPFVQQHIPGNISFDDFSITFKVSEDMSEYLELLTWMYNLGMPESLEQHKYRKSDCTALILNSSKKPAIQAKFTDAYPVSLSPIDLDITQTDINYVTSTAVFKFLTFDYSTI